MPKPTIEDAIAFAALAHKGQKDKVGKPYIFHPLSIMNRLETENEKIAGVTHDTLEDCGVTVQQLMELGYSTEVIEALIAVTKQPHEENDYPAFIQRVRQSSTLAIKVKLADLADNTDPSRRTEDNEKTRARQEKYQLAIWILNEELKHRE